jgi:hypothetical protein
MSGWSARHTRKIAFNGLFFISFLNFCILFMLIPLLSHLIHKNVSAELTIKLIQLQENDVPIKINDKHSICFKEKNSKMLKDISIITTQDNQVLITFAQSAQMNLEKKSLELKDGLMYHMHSPDDILHFDAMNFALQQNEVQLSRSGMTLTELKNAPKHILFCELNWRIFLILQSWIVIAGFLNKKIGLRKSTHFNRLLFEAMVLFCITTVLGLLISKFFQQGLFAKTIIPYLMLTVILITGCGRSMLNDQ